MLKDNRLEILLSDLSNLEKAGGPSPDQYEQVVALFDEIATLHKDPKHQDALIDFRRSAESFSSLDSMHGFVCQKPHGYAGDFEIIDRIYRMHHSANERHVAWDAFFHSGDAPKAVRGRKDYSVSLFEQIARRQPHGATILNVASGPCRDVLEFKSRIGEGIEHCQVHCIDIDRNAIDFSRTLLRDHEKTVTFENKNIFRSRFSTTFDLVWCAGLFDYLDNKRFVYLLKKLYDAVRKGGELVIGNFGPNTRSKSYMEFGDWYLIYRSHDELVKLALQAGIPSTDIHIGNESTGVNLFLHIRR